jgi:chlorobactene glucosyltransferase
MKKNWWLWLQALGGLLFASRVWPVIATLYKKEQWETQEFRFPLPKVSVIVPARNEERGIERCVHSLAGMHYPDFEVIVVNDGSTDTTPQILADLEAKYTHVKVVNLHEELPEGWAGKVHAMYKGVEAASPDSTWFLFTDADTLHAPGSLERSITRALQERSDMLSALPDFEMLGFWEKILMPIAFIGISLQYPLKKVNSPDNKLAIASGGYLLLRRSAYRRVGGWEALKASLLDDRDMAILVKGSGAKLTLVDGRQLLRVRMYSNLAEIWRGWRKNAFVGSRAAYLAIPLFILAGLYMGVMPFLQVPFALLGMLFGGREGRRRYSSVFWFSLWQCLLIVGSRMWLDKALKIPASYSFFSPLGALIFCGILLDSMWRSLKGSRGVSWKGRVYKDTVTTQRML